MKRSVITLRTPALIKLPHHPRCITPQRAAQGVFDRDGFAHTVHKLPVGTDHTIALSEAAQLDDLAVIIHGNALL